MNEPPILTAADTVDHLYCQRGDPALSVVTAQVDASSGRDRPPPSAEGVQPWFGPTPTPLAAGESQTARVSRRSGARRFRRSSRGPESSARADWRRSCRLPPAGQDLRCRCRGVGSESGGAAAARGVAVFHRRESAGRAPGGAIGGCLGATPGAQLLAAGADLPVRPSARRGRHHSEDDAGEEAAQVIRAWWAAARA
jgi:hypothetical protein